MSATTMRTFGSTICFLSLVFSSFFGTTLASKKSYVVYLGAHSRQPNLEVTEFDYNKVRDDHYTFLGSFLGSKQKAEESIIYCYTRYINGFAAVLDDAEAAEIAKHPEVVSVFLNKGRKLQTTRSWEFLGLESNGGTIEKTSAWSKARFGEDTIIATLDTGVWPESKSFSDDGYGPIPAKWKGGCENENDATFKCNSKLIGARYFSGGYNSVALSQNMTTSYNSPRDTEGHGSHTLSTAGGTFVPGASLFGMANGTAKGGSPRARVAAYKVCGPPLESGNQCYDSDILAGFDMAIHDGVDVISVSLGGGAASYDEDGLSIGAFHAVKHGIVVVCSAGNSGPDAGTVSNVAPWIITVGANTMDREVVSYLTLGNKLHFRGQSFSDKTLPVNSYYPIVDGKSVKAANASAADADLCTAGTLDPSKVKGKILVCLRGVFDRIQKGINAASAGAVGMVLVNPEEDLEDIFPDFHVLPAVNLGYTEGVAVYAYLSSTKSPVASLGAPTTELGIKPAPMMADFSSRGPNTITPEILKPDITAPGVNILAAFTEAIGVSSEPFDTRKVPFSMLSGTSMSCPHVSGVVGLLKTLHPDWSPAAIRSAIMTTARTRDNAGTTIPDAATKRKATPLSYGAGQVRPTRAMDPGLVYDLAADDYLNFLCALGYNQSQISYFSGGPYTCPKPISLLSFNYPSITVPNFNGTVTLTRTLKNVGSPGTYTVKVVNPPRLSIKVEPENLTFTKIGEEKTFTVTISATQPGAAKIYVFGTLTWKDGKHSVRSQVVVKALEAKSEKKTNLPLASHSSSRF